MPKIKIKVGIKNDNHDDIFETNAIIEEGKLKYREKDDTMVIFSFDDSHLKRENNQLKMNYYFDLENNTKGILYIKELQKEMELSIITKEITKDNNNIKIEFYIEDNHFLYYIEEVN